MDPSVNCFNHLDLLALCNDDAFKFLFKKLTMFIHCFLFSLQIKDLHKISLLSQFDYFRFYERFGGSAEPPNLGPNNRDSAEPKVRCNP